MTQKKYMSRNVVRCSQNWVSVYILRTLCGNSDSVGACIVEDKCIHCSGIRDCGGRTHPPTHPPTPTRDRYSQEIAISMCEIYNVQKIHMCDIAHEQNPVKTNLRRLQMQKLVFMKKLSVLCKTQSHRLFSQISHNKRINTRSFST